MLHNPHKSLHNPHKSLHNPHKSCTILANLCTILTNRCTILTNLWTIHANVCTIVTNLCTFLTNPCKIITDLCGILTELCHVLTNLCTTLTGLKIPPPPPQVINHQHWLLGSHMWVFLLYYMKVYLLRFCIIISPPIYTYRWEFFLLGISWIWWIWWWISAFIWHWCLPVCFLLNGRLPATTRHIQCVLGLVQLTVFQNNNERNKLLK